MSYDCTHTDCVICYVRLLGSIASERVDICTMCLFSWCKDNGRMRLVHLLGDKEFIAHGLCEICCYETRTVNISLCSSHGGTTK